MRVVATAGHVDHGKSTLVRALTGTDPDRWAEEHARGLTIDLGFAHTTLPSGETVAFVDVPGHQRFIANMLAGLGPAPAVLFVVAADEGWRTQSAEHLAAIDALGLRHGVLVITRSDLADPAAALAQARGQLQGTSLDGCPAVTVSGTTGAGLDELRAALDALCGQLPTPDPAARARLWVDRSFTLRGAGTVVTGTLEAGSLRSGEKVWIAGREVGVRRLQSLGADVTEVPAVARVAVNLRGLPVDAVQRGDALLTGDWHHTAVVDARVPAGIELPERLMMHVGTAATEARVRPLGAGAVRLSWPDPLPLQVGDRLVLRDPGRQLVLAGAVVLDADPPDLSRRGAARARAEWLADAPERIDVGREVARRGFVDAATLRRLGAPTIAEEAPVPPSIAEEAPPPTIAEEPAERASRSVDHGLRTGNKWLRDAPSVLLSHRSKDDLSHRSKEGLGPGASGGLSLRSGWVRVGDWLMSPEQWQAWADTLAATVRAHAKHHPLQARMPMLAAAEAVGLPDSGLIAPLAEAAGLTVTDGHLAPPGAVADLGPAEAGLREIEQRLAAAPFRAPERDELAVLNLGVPEIAAAVRLGRLIDLGDQIVLAPKAPALAMRELVKLPQPFTTSQARQALDTTRRVVIPLLEHLDRRGWTRRLDANRRTVATRGEQSAPEE